MKNDVPAITAEKRKKLREWALEERVFTRGKKNQDTWDTTVLAYESYVKELEDALEAANELCEKALPKFNWGKSALDATAIRLLNEVPGLIRQALRK